MRIEGAIRQRRSVRQYTKEMPKEADIERILGSGTWAPSGLNNQPWKFKIVKGKTKDALAAFTKYGDIIKNSPLAILVFLDAGASYNREKDIMAVGACIQNMLLSAFELGYGTCWLGEILNKRKEIEKSLKIDSDHELMACVTLGRSDEGVAESCRRGLKSFILD